MKTEFFDHNINEASSKLLAESMNNLTDILLIKHLVKTIGNDQELGEKIRELINKENETLSER